MPVIKSITIQCGHCGAKFPSEIFFGDTETLHSAITRGNTQTCPACKKTVNCNKDNVSYVLADGSGGGLGDNFSDNKA